MSKRSTVTVRSQPVAESAAASGAVHVKSHTLSIETDERVKLIDLTDRIMRAVHGLGVREGMAHVFSMHTTCTVFINEYQQALLTDITAFLEQLAPRNADWRHNDPRFSDCDRMNADAHLRALLLGHSLTLPVSGGEVVLGQWQRVLLAELDGPRTRSIRVAAMGV
jgi:secondary thiamine-phosphate synthase enzyme